MKVVGIGLPKTGTTSLHAALTILGYKCIHHPVAYHGQIMLNGNYTPPKGYNAMVNTAEDFYPILASMFPDCKFVLTTRDINRWLASWAKKDQLFEEQEKLQRLDRIRVFGTCRFVPKKFKSVFVNHTHLVEEYFEDSDRLLVLSLEDHDKWRSLCDFLGKSVPDIPYPHKRKSKR